MDHIHVGYDKGTALSDQFRNDAQKKYPNWDWNEIRGKGQNLSINRFPSRGTPSNIDPRIRAEYEKANSTRDPKDVLAFQQKFHQLFPNVAKNIIQDNGNLTNWGQQSNLSINDLNSNEDGIWGPRTDQYMAYINQSNNTNNIGGIRESNTNSEVNRTIGNTLSDGRDIYSNNAQPINSNGLNFSTRKRPSNARGLELGNIAPELYALATSKQDPVPHFSYDPTLYTPYQVSFQDRLNENNATFKSIEQQLPNNAPALSVLAAQKYSADNQVLADQFRTNQSINSDITNKNVELLNQSGLINLQLDQQQADKQAQAKFNTRREIASAIGSLSSKYQQNQLENRTLQAYENLYQYRFDKDGNAVDYNDPATFLGKSFIAAQGQDPDKVIKKVNYKGEESTTTINNSDLDDLVKARDAIRKGATYDDVIQSMPHLKKYTSLNR